MVHAPSGLKRRLWGPLLLGVLLTITACGTLEIAENETATPATPLYSVTPTASAAPPSVETPSPLESGGQGTPLEVIAWYGQIHSVSGADPNYDYLKLWHLNLWPKFGRAVGLYGHNPAIDAEIDRVRDRDTRVTVWGTLACGVGDYGACQLRVTRFSANDGGPTFDPERVEGWEGTIGWLPAPPGSEESIHYFVLAGEIPALYGIATGDPAMQAELERLQNTETIVRIWGELRSRVQPVTGTLIDIDRLEVVQATPSP
jgi:hypothetical protein